MSKIGLVMDRSSVSALNKRFEQIKQSVLERGEKVVSKNTQTVFERAQARCPVDTAALHASAKMAVETKEDLIGGAIGYGSETANPRTGKLTSLYAVERHEALTLLNPAAYKWLERSSLEQSDDFQKDLVETYSDLFGGG